MFQTPSQPTAFDRMIRRSQVLRERKYRPLHPQVDAALASRADARRIWRAWDLHDRTTFLADYVSRFREVTSSIADAILERAFQLSTKPEVIYEHD